MEILAFCRESKGVVRWSQGHHGKEGEDGQRLGCLPWTLTDVHRRRAHLDGQGGR